MDERVRAGNKKNGLRKGQRMFRYIALVWNVTDEQQSRTAESLEERLRARLWTPAFVSRMLPSAETTPAAAKAAAVTPSRAFAPRYLAMADAISGVVGPSSTFESCQAPPVLVASARRVRVPPTSPTRIIASFATAGARWARW